MRKVRDILKHKPEVVYFLEPDTAVFKALELLVEKNIGALVVKQSDKILGIFTERDYARKVVLKGKSSKDISVGEIMTENPNVVTPDETIECCMNLMADKSIRYLLVVEHGKLMGILSIGDLVKSIIADQENTINNLHKYISGS